MKAELRHVQIRLSSDDRRQLEAQAEELGVTISERARQLLFDITHALQCERMPERHMLTRRYHGRIRLEEKLDVRMPRDIHEYLRFNGYNITTCLLYSLWTQRRTT